MYRVIQWATGGWARPRSRAYCATPSSNSSAAGCTAPTNKDGRDVANSSARTRSGWRRAPTSTRCWPPTPIASCIPRCCPTTRSSSRSCGPARTWSPRSAGSTRTATTLRAGHRGGRAGRRVTLHGSGIHPGGITERFPLMISSLSSAITHVRAEEFSDIPHLQRAAGGARGDGLRPDPEQAMSGPIAAPCLRPASNSRCGWSPTNSASAPSRASGPPRRSRSPSAAPTNWWCRWKPARWPPAGSAGRRSWTTSRWSPRRSTG